MPQELPGEHGGRSVNAVVVVRGCTEILRYSLGSSVLIWTSSTCRKHHKSAVPGVEVPWEHRQSPTGTPYKHVRTPLALVTGNTVTSLSSQKNIRLFLWSHGLWEVKQCNVSEVETGYSVMRPLLYFNTENQHFSFKIV